MLVDMQDADMDMLNRKGTSQDAGVDMLDAGQQAGSAAGAADGEQGGGASSVEVGKAHADVARQAQDGAGASASLVPAGAELSEGVVQAGHGAAGWWRYGAIDGLHSLFLKLNHRPIGKTANGAGTGTRTEEGGEEGAGGRGSGAERWGGGEQPGEELLVQRVVHQE